MRAWHLLFIASVLSGCLPGQIDELGDQASTRVVSPSSVFEFPGFGSVLTGLRGQTEDGTLASRIVATAGSGTPFAFVEAETGGQLALRRELFHGCATAASGCGSSAGASLAALDSFGGRSLCAAIGAPAEGEVLVACEGDLGTVERVASGLPAGSRLGRAMAPLRDVTWGQAVVSAPGAGGLYTITGAGGLDPIALPDGVGDSFSDFGSALAAAPLPDSAALGLSDASLVVVAQGSPFRLVALAVGRDPASAALVGRSVACVDGLGGGLTLAAADVSGDGVPEIFFSEESGTTLMHDGVRMLRLGGAGAVGCGDPGTADDPATTALACPADDRVDCAGFGAALAAGDLDADGDADVLVGAPDSDVDGVRAAGAVFVFSGERDGFGEVHVSALVDSHPRADDRLGVAVGTVTTGLGATPREEPVVAAGGFGADGGTSRLLIFLCSGIPGDSAADAPRCQP